MTAPFAYWVGMDTPSDADSRTLAEFNAFYDKTHLPEVLEYNPGFVRATRYELLIPDSRGDFGPRWLAMYEMADEAAAKRYIERNDGPPEGRPAYTPGLSEFGTKTRWRMIWRQIAAFGTETAEPDAMFIVGMNVPPSTSPQGLAEFNDFYTGIHVPEVMQWGGYAHAVRFELYRQLLHPAPGCPGFLALYEGDRAATEAMQARGFGPARQPSTFTFSDGPPTWQQHDTRWRSVYRQITRVASRVSA